MIPSSTLRTLFGNVKKEKSVLTELARLHLDLHQIPWKNAISQIGTDEDLKKIENALNFCKLPALKGNNLDSHYRTIALELSSSWLNRAKLLQLSSLPPFPNFNSIPSTSFGWFRFESFSDIWVSVPHPTSSEDLIFDVETCPRISKYSILAVAASSKSWYIWISPIFDRTEIKTPSELLVPLGKDHLVVGHNVSYDRARVLEEYSLDSSNDVNFLDTMALHCAVSGLSNQQRTFWLKHRKMKRSLSKNPDPDDDEPIEKPGHVINLEEEELDSFDDISNYADSCLGRWLFHSAPNSLVEAAAFHCNESIASKEDRTFLVNATELDEIKSRMIPLIRYCANDVLLTFKLFKAVWLKFMSYNSHPATFSAMLMMGKMILTSDAGWFSWISECENQLSSFSKKLEDALNKLVLEIIATYSKDEAWKKDPWLKHLDWTPVPARYCLLSKPKKPSKKKKTSSLVEYEPVEEPNEAREYDYNRPIGNTLFFGQPFWYKELWNASKKAVVISPRMTIVPYLLGMTWHNYPLHHLGVGKGWHYEISYGSYIPVPPPEGRMVSASDSKGGHSVGTLISKGFSTAFKNGILKATRHPELAEMGFEACIEFSFWTAYRSRVVDVLAIDLNNESNEIAILPQMCPMGTITRRATDRLWLTSTSSSKSSVLGSDLKSRMVAPRGWKFVGADVDSQELWISSILGDAQFGEHGSTALSWMSLAGNKVEGTDLHSKTAKLLGNGATRELAKIFNYARFYGSGVKFAAALLQSNHPHLSTEKCNQKAVELYRQTKGIPSSSHDNLLAGGSESFTFNSLSALALGGNFSLTKQKKVFKIRTPVLKCQITDALSPWNVGEETQFSTSRMNWVVQSSAVDYLHLLLTGIAWLSKKHNIKSRLAITIHDEVRWLVKEEDATRMAIALQIVNLWTRAAFSEALGISDLPLSAAFFSSVEIDSVLRKDPTSPCLSPTRQIPIPPGQSFSFAQLVEERRREIGKQSGVLDIEDLLGPPTHGRWDEFVVFDSLQKRPEETPGSSFISKDIQERISMILAQDKFTLHPAYVAKIAPLLKIQKLKKGEKNMQKDEFGDIIYPSRMKHNFK